MTFVLASDSDCVLDTAPSDTEYRRQVSAKLSALSAAGVMTMNTLAGALNVIESLVAAEKIRAEAFQRLTVEVRTLKLVISRLNNELAELKEARHV